MITFCIVFAGEPNSQPNDTFFHCRDGRWLSPELKCNFKEECLHGDDESGCEKPSECDKSLDQFRCNSGECVRYQYRCDGVVDCWDKSDEIGCGWYSSLITKL